MRQRRRVRSGIPLVKVAAAPVKADASTPNVLTAAAIGAAEADGVVAATSTAEAQRPRTSPAARRRQPRQTLEKTRQRPRQTIPERAHRVVPDARRPVSCVSFFPLTDGDKTVTKKWAAVISPFCWSVGRTL